jgi:hypothetical protein
VCRPLPVLLVALAQPVLSACRLPVPNLREPVEVTNPDRVRPRKRLTDPRRPRRMGSRLESDAASPPFITAEDRLPRFFAPRFRRPCRIHDLGRPSSVLRPLVARVRWLPDLRRADFWRRSTPRQSPPKLVERDARRHWRVGPYSLFRGLPGSRRAGAYTLVIEPVSRSGAPRL